MDAADWEREFEEAAARERELMIGLLDAARALTGALRPSGTSPADALDVFAQRFEAWSEAADGIERLAENRLAQR